MEFFIMTHRMMLTLSAAAASVAVAGITAGITFAVKQQGGWKRTMIRLKKSSTVTGATRKLGSLKKRLGADNDDTNRSVAA